MKVQEQRNPMKLTSERSVSPSVSIMMSKKQIVDIENAIDCYGENAGISEVSGIRNRHITTGMIVDWKQFQEKGKVKSQLVARDGQNGQKTIFSYVIEEWQQQQPSKVIYRWVRTVPKSSQQLPQIPTLLQEEHIYRGPVKSCRKHGEGTYIINRKYSDNSEKLKRIKGEWFQDILRKGSMTDQLGNQQVITSNLLRMSMQSKKTISPYLEKNTTIEELRKKTANVIQPQTSNQIITSMASIKEKLRIR